MKYINIKNSVFIYTIPRMLPGYYIAVFDILCSGNFIERCFSEDLHSFHRHGSVHHIPFYKIDNILSKLNK